MRLSDNATKIVTTVITSIAGILTVGIITTGFFGQWWVTPKHRAKAISMVINSYKDSGIVTKDGKISKEDADQLEKDVDFVTTGKK